MEERTPKPVVWGWVLTGGVLLFAVVLGVVPTCDPAGECQSKFAAFWSAPPNEVGDTLAGFAGALAFVWIIVTVMLQSKELKAQREELRLTRSEMEEQRKATQDMARSMEAQAEIFEDEKRRRDEVEAKEMLEHRLQAFKFQIETLDGAHWTPRALKASRPVFLNMSTKLFAVPAERENWSIDEFFAQQYRHVFKLKKELRKSPYPEAFTVMPSADIVVTAMGRLQAILALEQRLGENQRERLGNIGLYGLRAELEEISKLPIWRDMEPTQ